MNIKLTVMQKSTVEELNLYLKTKAFLYLVRQKCYHILSQSVINNFSKDIKASTPFKFYVDNTGNNHILVKSILKRRTWL